MIEQTIIDLTEAVRELTAAIKNKPGATVSLPNPTPAGEPEKPKRVKKTEEAAPEPAPEAQRPEPTPEPAAPAPAPATPPEEAKPVTIEDLRLLGSKLIAAGRGAEFKAACAKFSGGEAKISAVPVEKHPEFHVELSTLLATPAK